MLKKLQETWRTSRRRYGHLSSTATRLSVNARNLGLEQLEDRRVLSTASPELEWIQQFGQGTPENEFGRAVDSDGNAYVVGYVPGSLPGFANSGSIDAFVRKFDGNGNELWTRQFGTESQDSATGVAVNDTRLYVTGHTSGQLSEQPNLGGSDAFLRAYDLDGNEIWTRQFGSTSLDEATAIAVYESGLYVTGRTGGQFPGESSSGADDAFLQKFDLDGSTIWVRQFGSDQFDEALGVSANENIVVAGRTNGAIPQQSNTGSLDAFLRSYDSDGVEQWTRQFGSSENDQASDVASTTNEIFVAGYFGTGGNEDGFVRKYDSNGTLQWERMVVTSYDHVNAIALAADGTADVYVAGETNGTFPGETSAGNTDAFIQRLDSSGNVLWTRQFGTTGSDQAFGIAGSSTGVVATGHTSGTFPGQTGSGLSDVFVHKLDPSGAELWTRQFGSLGPSEDLGFAVDSSGSVFFAGTTRNTGFFFDTLDAIVRRIDSDGNVVWERQFGSLDRDEASAIAVDNTGVYVAGHTWLVLPGQTRAGSADVFVRKYDLNGNELWTRQFGSGGFDTALSLALDATALYIVGNTEGVLANQVGYGGKDAYVRKYDLDGTEIWTRQFGTADDDDARDIAVADGNVYITGPTWGVFPGETALGTVNAYVHKFDTSGNALWVRQFGTDQRVESYSVVADSMGAYVTGMVLGALPGEMQFGQWDAFIQKLTPDGNQAWSRQFGSVLTDVGYGIALDNSGLYVSGETRQALPGQVHAGSADAYLQKFDFSGNPLWTKQLGTSASDVALGVIVEPSIVYVVGHTQGEFPGVTRTVPFGVDAFIAKFSSLPTADAGGPYFVASDATIDLDASATSDIDQDPQTLIYEWDLDGDGIFAETNTAATRGDETGSSPTFSAAGLLAGTQVPVNLRVIDDLGGTSEASTTILIGGPTGLENAINDVSNAGAAELQLSAGTSTLESFLTAVASLPGITSGDTFTITIVLENGTLKKNQTVSVPEGYTLVIDGKNGQTVFEGGSPALIVESGEVVVTNGVRFINSTSAPTILVNGGSLTLRDVIVEETIGGDFAAILITAGSVDLGTAAEAGGNTIVVHGDGEAIRNEAGTDQVARGNTFQLVQGDNPILTLTSPFDIEEYVFHGFDLDGLGFVSFAGNVDPLVTISNISPLVVAIGAPVTFSGEFSDVGTIQTHTAQWSTQPSSVPAPIVFAGDVDEIRSSGTVTAVHSFDVPGVRSVLLSVTDDEGGTGAANLLDGVEAMVVVYDPSGGFVTGGGWIDSPAGAYTAVATLAGRASFGLNSKYEKGANVPTGETQFNFRVADLNFHSDTYDWLVVAGPQAKFKGTGTINDVGDYGFMLTAVDGQVNGGGGADKFRIKIWDRTTGEVIYDNQIGADDDAPDASELGGGQIVIHTGAKKLTLEGSEGVTVGAKLSPAMLDAAVGEATAYWASAGIASDRLASLVTFDVELAALPGTTLGLTSNSTNKIWLDVDAAGRGWTLDGARAGVDLRSAVTHELGHALGFDHDVLGETLASGERHLPGIPDRMDLDRPARLESLLPRSLVDTDAIFDRIGSLPHDLLYRGPSRELRKPRSLGYHRAVVPETATRSEIGSRESKSLRNGKNEKDTEQSAQSRDLIFESLGGTVDRQSEEFERVGPNASGSAS